ncbi:MAG: M50 family metallopeptidase [Anaerolineae bacterium]|nr:M50 family metallopeptidase [Anaerolineae bacterium]
MNNDKFSKNSSPNDTISHQQTLILIGLAGLAAVVLAVIPWLGPLNYSFRLLITLVHELGHGLAALLTGGTFVRFLVSSDGSGLAYTAGGWRFFVIPAGYLGVALFGAILIMLGRNHRWSRIAMVVIGLIMILFSLRYGTPSIFTNQMLSGLLTTVSGVFFGSLFLLVALKASDRWIIFLLHFIAIRAGLTAFSDIVTVIGLSIPSLTPARSDAQSMADLTFIPAIMWAVLWAIVATVIMVSAVWFTWLKPGRIQIRATDKSPRRLPLS